ncbi:hypothetical protein Btru_072509 [Bulinus truncatus]|nr:hypothetical protein Btru_072509 [Bulinus truncatus]
MYNRVTVTNPVYDPAYTVTDWNLVYDPVYTVTDWDLVYDPVYTVTDWNLVYDPVYTVTDWDLVYDPVYTVIDWDLVFDPFYIVIDWDLVYDPVYIVTDWDLVYDLAYTVTESSKLRSYHNFRKKQQNPTEYFDIYVIMVRPKQNISDEDNIFQKCFDNIFLKSHYKNYEVNVINSSTVEIKCLHNFHLLSGDTYSHCLPNGQWIGQEPVCEVDYYKERFRLSSFIIFVTAAIVIFFLSIDFSCFLQRRCLSRQSQRRLHMYKVNSLYRRNLCPRQPNAVNWLHLIDSIEQKSSDVFPSNPAEHSHSEFGAFGQSMPVTNTLPANSQSPDIKTNQYQRGLYVFRLKNKPFSMQDPESQRDPDSQRRYSNLNNRNYDPI